MTSVKRRFPYLVWLVAFFITPLLFAPGILPVMKVGLHMISYSGIQAALDFTLAPKVLPEVFTALYAVLICLLAGYPLSFVMAKSKHRSKLAGWLFPLSALIGGILLHSRQLLPLLPHKAAQVLFTLSSLVPPAITMALSLLPLFILCTSSYILVQDPAFYKTARGLGASPFASFMLHIFPRSITGALLGFLIVYASALGLALITAPVPYLPANTLLITCAVLCTADFLILSITLLTTKKPRRAAPC